MTTINSSNSHTSDTDQTTNGSPRDGETRGGRVRAQLLTDAVIAGYIHHISARHRNDGSPEEPDEFYLRAEAA